MMASAKEKTGVLYGIGTGPGDPELLTLKAVRLLSEAPVLAYPTARGARKGESLARKIAAPHLSLTCQEIEITVPMIAGPEMAEETAMAYDKGAEEIATHLSNGEDVVLLCLGDPLLYGSFTNIFSRLAARFPVEIIPGITSICAAAASAKTPIATRNESFSVIPAPLEDEAIRKKLAASDSAAIIKIGRHFGRIHALLQDMGLEKRARYIAHASDERELVLPLDSVSPDQISYFSLILLEGKETS